MRLMFNTHSSDGDYNGDCDYAVVDLTPALAEEIRSRVNLARQAGQQDADLYELYFWGSTAQFYDCALLEACGNAIAASSTDEAASDWQTGLDQDGYAVVPPDVDLDAYEPQPTECDQMVVRICPSAHEPEYEVCWTASPKHSDVYVTTSDLPLANMEELLAIDRQ